MFFLVVLKLLNVVLCELAAHMCFIMYFPSLIFLPAFASFSVMCRVLLLQRITKIYTSLLHASVTPPQH